MLGVRVASFAQASVAVLIPLAAWAFASAILPQGALPGPFAIFREMLMSSYRDPLILFQGGGSHGYLPHVWSTFWHVGLGGVAGIVAGVFCTLLAVQKPSIRVAWNTILEFFRTIPPLVLVPFVAVVFGTSDLGRIVTVGAFAAFTAAVYTFNALGNLPAQYIQLATLLGASRWRRLRSIQLPGIIPELLGSVRLIFAFGLGISIVVEYLGSDDGIGQVMRVVMAYSRVDLVMVGVLWTVLLAFIFDAGIVILFGAFTSWTERKQLLEWISR